MSDSKLVIYFINTNKRLFENVRLLGRTFTIKKNKLDIPICKEIFSKSKGKKIIDFELIQGHPLGKSLKFKMNIFYGINKAYCFLSEEEQILIEYNFFEYEGIFYGEKELNEYDGNGFIKRIILINAPMKITIKNKLITFYSVVANFVDKGDNSFEICDCDYTIRNFSVKIIEDEEKFNSFNIVRNQKDILNIFYTELKCLISQNFINKDKFKEIFAKYKIQIYEINFCQPKSLLKEEFQTKDDFYLIYIYLLWFFVNSLINNKNKNKFDKFVVDLFKEMTSLYELYLNDNDLLIYEKILLFCSNVNFLFLIGDIAKYKNYNLTYVVKRRDIKDKSVYGFAFKFLKEFISKLNEKSYLFFPILMLDCGLYNNNNDYVYGFNRESCEVIKSHLEELVPEFFFEYDDKGNEGYKEHGFNYKGLNVVFLNRYILLQNFAKDPKKDIYSNIDEENLFKHYSMRVSKTTMHESFAHIKFRYEKKRGLISPLKFYNRKKILVEMITNTSDIYKKDNVEYLKVLIKNSSGESGKFFEYFFGIFDSKLIIDLIFDLDNLSKLYDNVDLFVMENLNELQSYIINKYKIIYYKLEFSGKNLSFKDENKLMEQTVRAYEEKIPLSSRLGYNNQEDEDNKNDNYVISKKNIIFHERVKEEKERNRGYEFYRRKLFDEDNVEDREKYYAPYIESLHTS